MEPRSKLTQILYLEDGREKLVEAADFLKQHSIEGLIRLRLREFINLPEKGIFIHFNFQRGGHKVGAKYALPWIIRPGSVTPDGETLPLLSFRDIRLAECAAAQEEVSYDKIPLSALRKSLYNVKSVDALKTEIRKRYSTVLTDMTPEDFEKAGVGITKLKIIGSRNEQTI